MRTRGAFGRALSAAVLGLAPGACSPFGGAELVPPPPFDAGPLEAGTLTSSSLCERPTFVDDPSATANASCTPGAPPVSLQTDPGHCGACRHACETCTRGACAPTPLLPDENVRLARIVGAPALEGAPSALVYYVDGHKFVRAASLDGAEGAPRTDFVALLGTAAHIEVDGEALWISSDKEQLRIPLDGRPATDVELGPAPRGGRMALGDTFIYYGYAGKVLRRPKGMAVPRVEVDAPELRSLAVYGDSAYFTAKTPEGRLAVQGPIPDVRVLATPPDPVALAVDATHVYFADATLREIRRVARTGGDSQQVAREDGRIGELVLADDSIYWTADRGFSGWAIVRVAKCGGLPLVLARDLGELTQLSVDTGYVYAAQGRLGKLLRAPR